MEVGSDREELLARLARLPSQIEADDIPDLVTLAQVYSSRLKRVDNEFFFHYSGRRGYLRLIAQNPSNS